MHLPSRPAVGHGCKDPISGSQCGSEGMFYFSTGCLCIKLQIIPLFSLFFSEITCHVENARHVVLSF